VSTENRNGETAPGDRPSQEETLSAGRVPIDARRSWHIPIRHIRPRRRLAVSILLPAPVQELAHTPDPKLGLIFERQMSGIW
jgi:hypothetical protein